MVARYWGGMVGDYSLLAGLHSNFFDWDASNLAHFA